MIELRMDWNICIYENVTMKIGKTSPLNKLVWSEDYYETRPKPSSLIKMIKIPTALYSTID